MLFRSADTFGGIVLAIEEGDICDKVISLDGGSLSDFVISEVLGELIKVASIGYSSS